MSLLAEIILLNMYQLSLVRVCYHPFNNSREIWRVNRNVRVKRRERKNMEKVIEAGYREYSVKK